MSLQVQSQSIDSPATSKLDLIDRKERLRRIQEHIRRQPNRPIAILEAGCGRKWPLQLDVEYRLTGVDIDQDALNIRQNQSKDLDIGILGDLHSVNLPAASFDAIYSNFVLEHIEGAEGVLDNFVRWLRPGGIMILTVPDRDSVYGFFTRITPFKAHVLYKKYLAGDRDAGKPGHGPFRTFHDQVIGRRGLRAFAQSRGLSVLEECRFNSKAPKSVRAFMQVVSLLTFRHLSADMNLLYVVKKQ
jgi:SAM-dependent methyltransferase